MILVAFDPFPAGRCGLNDVHGRPECFFVLHLLAWRGHDDLKDPRRLHGKLDQLLPEMQAVGLGPRFILHGRAFPEGVVQHGAAVFPGLAARDVPLRHPVAVGVLLLQLRQLLLHFHLAPNEDRHTLIGHGLAERVEHLPQRDERHHLNIHPFEHPHSLVPPSRAALSGGLHELADGPCHRLNAAFQEHFPVAGIRFRITFGVAGHRRVVAVPAPVGHFLFKLNLAGEKRREGQAVVLVVAVGVFGNKDDFRAQNGCIS